MPEPSYTGERGISSFLKSSDNFLVTKLTYSFVFVAKLIFYSNIFILRWGGSWITTLMPEVPTAAALKSNLSASGLVMFNYVL